MYFNAPLASWSPLTALVNERVARGRVLLQPHAQVREEHLVVGHGPEERHVADDAGVQVPQNDGTEVERQRGQHLLPVVWLDLLLLEEVEDSLAQGAREVHVIEERSDGLELLAVGVAHAVQLGDDRRHPADDERKEEAAADHGHYRPDLLRHRDAADVAVAHRGHGRVGPVHRGDVPAEERRRDVVGVS